MQTIRVNLIDQLIESKEDFGIFLSIDSAAVPLIVREKNFKTYVKNQFDKSKPPKRDSETRLNALLSFKNPFKREKLYCLSQMR